MSGVRRQGGHDLPLSSLSGQIKLSSRDQKILLFQFPLCGEKCVGKKIHKAECQIFSRMEKKINFDSLTDNKHPVYTTIAPLRFVDKTGQHLLRDLDDL